MIEQQQTPTPTQSRNSLTTEKPAIESPSLAATIPAGVSDQTPVAPASEDPPGLQLKIAIPYLATLLVSFYLAVTNAGANFKVAMAWLVVGIVSSQVVVDLAEFSSPRAKARFSATYRILAGLAALGFAYLG